MQSGQPRKVLISGRGWDSQALKAALTQLSDVGFHLTEAPTLIQNTLLVAGCSTCFLIANDADAKTNGSAIASFLGRLERARERHAVVVSLMLVPPDRPLSDVAGVRMAALADACYGADCQLLYSINIGATVGGAAESMAKPAVARFEASLAQKMAAQSSPIAQIAKLSRGRCTPADCVMIHGMYGSLQQIITADPREFVESSPLERSHAKVIADSIHREMYLATE